MKSLPIANGDDNFGHVFRQIADAFQAVVNLQYSHNET